VFVQDQVKLNERWVFTGAVRRDEVKAKTDGETNTDDAAWSKNLGAVYLLEDGWAPYAGYSESFEAVAGTDAAGTPFQPKRGKQFEAGVKYALPDQRVVATAAAFHLVA
jgi:iron complex outermembrane recepter protein